MIASFASSSSLRSHFVISLIRNGKQQSSVFLKGRYLILNIFIWGVIRGGRLLNYDILKNNILQPNNFWIT